MSEYTREQLTEIIAKHKLWLDREEGGDRANLDGANLVRANLYRANLYGANLYGANLYGANLYRANLDGANLDGANLWGCAGNRNEIKSLFLSEDYSITYTAKHMQIGCEKHEIKEWWDFDDKRILDMDGKSGLKFWRKYKDFIKSAIELSPATPVKELAKTEK